MWRSRFCLKYRFHLVFFAFLVGSLFLVYGQIGSFGVLHNDDIYLIDYYENVMDLSVQKTLRTLFVTPDFYAYYSPVAKLFYLFDIIIYGKNIGWYRYTHVMLHAFSALFIFSLLYFTTGAKWRSAFVALLFAFHPMNSESVATFYARVNPLSGFMGIAALFFYCYYATGPAIRRYLPVIVFFVLSLLAKPSMMIIVLLFPLLDFWPLKRFSPGEKLESGHAGPDAAAGSGWNRLVIIEKIPFLIIVIVWFCFSSWYYNQTQFPALVASIPKSFAPTIIFVFLPVSFAAYLLKTFLPTGFPSYLSPLYDGPLPLWRCLGAIILFLLITGLILRVSRKHRYLITGWFWFLLILAPHVLITVSQGMLVMERYAYMPLIGLFILITWGGADLFQHFKIKKRMVGIISGLLLFVLAFTTWHQTGYRKDAFSFYQHALAVFPGNSEAHSRLGELFLNKGQKNEAVEHFYQAIKLDPENPNPHSHLGKIFAAANQPEKAVYHYQQALRIKPDYVAVHNNFANLLVELGKPEAAIFHYQSALRIKPDSYEIYNNLATVLINKGEFDQAKILLERALLAKPDYQTAKENLIRLELIKTHAFPKAKRG